MTRVEDLNLENNPVNDAGLRAFLRAGHWLSLRNLSPPRAGISELVRRLLVDRFNRPPRRG